MAWLWPSSPPARNESETGPQGSPPPPAAAAAAAAAAAPSSPSRDELADAELQDLLRSLDQAPSSPDNNGDDDDTTTTTATAATNPLDSTRRRHRRDLAPLSSLAADSIDPGALYPRTLSCRAAFDAAFYCQSLGGQFTNVYRYGSARGCAAEWGQFWFCMRTMRGALGDEERAERVRRRCWEREAERYGPGRPSSEDVWALRETRAATAFDGDLEAYERAERAEREAGERGGGG